MVREGDERRGRGETRRAAKIRAERRGDGVLRRRPKLTRVAKDPIGVDGFAVGWRLVGWRLGATDDVDEVRVETARWGAGNVHRAREDDARGTDGLRAEDARGTCGRLRERVLAAKASD